MGEITCITYTEEQIIQIRSLLNGITVTGIQNAKQIAVIDQLLAAGDIEKKGGEE